MSNISHPLLPLFISISMGSHQIAFSDTRSRPSTITRTHHHHLCLTFFAIIGCCLLLLSSPLTYVQGQTGAETIFKQIFNSGYDSSLRPGFNTTLNPVVIDVQFRINLLYAVDSKNEQYALDFFVRELWNDDRLKFDPRLWPDALGALRIPTSRAIWKPDTFFSNAVSCSTSDNLLTLNATGRLNWSRHQTCVFKADFDLVKFPFDSQTFSMKRVSYAYTQQELVLRPVTTGPCFLPDPTIGFENSLWDLSSADCSSQTFLFRVGQDDYWQVIGNLHVSRKYQNYIVKLILPMFVIVCLSTITYFIDAGAAPARVGGTVTLVLSIVTFNLVVSQDLPKINYSTLLDWYVWKCFLFVVFAVGEFACVNNILTTKVIPVVIAKLIDDFCAWTMLVTWCLSNLLFWPFTSNVPLRLFIGAVEIAFFSLNVYRTWWNWKHETIGIIQPARAMYAWWKARYVNAKELAQAAKELAQSATGTGGAARPSTTTSIQLQEQKQAQ